MVVDPTHHAFRLTVQATGYVGHESGFGTPHWLRRLPGPWYSVRDQFEVQLFRGQQPTADVTVPNDYRGVVAVKFAAESSPPAVPGRRSFSYTATRRGGVEIKEAALFESRGYYEGIRARYQDGFTLPTVARIVTYPTHPDEPSDETVALRFVTRNGKVWLYVLGTKAEALAVYWSVYPDNNRFDEAAFNKIVAEH
jgi:hypothetical protein